MRSFIFLLVTLSFITVSCSDSTKSSGINITGNFRNAGGVKLTFRELNVDAIRDLDSVRLDDIGLFRFHVNPAEAGFFLLSTGTGENIVLLLENEKEVNVAADLKKQPFVYEVSGSPGSALLRDFYNATLPNLVKSDSLRSLLMKNRESPDFYKISLSYDTLFMKIISDQKMIEKTFMEKNPNSLASLIALNYKFGMSPVLSIGDDFPLFLRIDSTLALKYPANRHVSFHHQRVLEHMRQEQEKESLKKSKF